MQAVRFPGDRIPKEGCYLTLRDGKWSSPIKVSQPDQGAVDVRIVVDGDDNVHVIYWSPGTPSGELGEHDNHRCYYRRKPAGSSDFEEALCFENSVATGPSSHGALAVGPRGELFPEEGRLGHVVKVYSLDKSELILQSDVKTQHLVCYRKKQEIAPS